LQALLQYTLTVWVDRWSLSATQKGVTFVSEWVR